MSALEVQLSQLEQALARNECDCDAHSVGRDLVRAGIDERIRDGLARSFDLRRVCEPWVRGMPDGTWPTSALVMTARDGILSPPWKGGLKRAVSITSALGLLGERGLPPDAFVRVYLARALSRRLISVSANAFVHARDNDRDWRHYPYQTSDLFERFSELESARAPLNDLTAEALGGEIMNSISTWLAQAAMAHVIDWRSTDYMVVQVESQDQVLLGGRDATMWVFDRFSYTSTDEWMRASTEWELAFARDPAATSAFVGVAQSVLDERPSSLEMAASAQVRRILSHNNKHEVARGLLQADMVEQIIAAIRRGDLESAVSDARHAYSLAPHEFSTVNALGFCLVPSQPDDALHYLRGISATTHIEKVLLAANCASAAISKGDWADAIAILGQIGDDETSDAYLWDVRLLAKGKAKIVYTRINDWIETARGVISEETAP